MLDRIKLGMILFLNGMNTSFLAWKEINKVMDEEKTSRLRVVSHIC